MFLKYPDRFGTLELGGSRDNYLPIHQCDHRGDERSCLLVNDPTAHIVALGGLRLSSHNPALNHSLSDRYREFASKGQKLFPLVGGMERGGRVGLSRIAQNRLVLTSLDEEYLDPVFAVPKCSRGQPEQ